MRRLFALVVGFGLTVSACTVSPSGVFVSPQAVDLGGNLYAEPIGDGASFLVLDGEITADTSYVFQSLVEVNEVSGLLITQSPGGDLLAAHQIGRTIKRNRLNTAVLGVCMSACVDVFIAGQRREIATQAELLLHSTEDVEFGYSIDKPYWEALGLGAVNDAAYKIDHNAVWIVPAQQALQLKLATHLLE